MTDESLDDDDDERETVAPESSPPREEGTAPAFDDLESLPGRRPARPQSPAPTPAPRKQRLPEPDDDLDAPAPTVAADFAPSVTAVPPHAVETPSSESPTIVPPSTEAPTREIEVEREMPTIAGTFAGSTPGGAGTEDAAEAATIAEIPESGRGGPTSVKGTLGTDVSGRKLPSGWKSPLSKQAHRTARDPVVGSAAMRGTQPGAPAAAAGLAEGQLLADRYELVQRLGKGGMGEVWKAKHILLQGMRAIKVIKASISKDPNFRQRFLQEGQTMMRVKHPGVVEVTDLDETRSNRELFMVMEYLEGRTIYDAVRAADRPLAADVRDAVRILREVALGMQRIHDERIVHKDLKSDNVLLVKGDDGLEHPKVIDFGLAKRLGDADAAPPDAAGSPLPAPHDADLRTTLSGTLAYMAPEQFRNEPSSFQSDIYAFGVMAYEVFTKGEYPLPRGSLVHYIDLHKEGKAPELLAKKRPDLDPKLASIFDRCMAVRRDVRPESFRDVAYELQWWLDAPERAARRKRVLSYGAAGAAVLAFGVWGIFFGGEKTASLSNVSVASAGAKLAFDGKVAHAPAAALRELAMTADIAGEPGTPVLEVDGRSRDARSEIRDGRLVFVADLSDLADGDHAVALRASSGASPALFVLDVDRKAPEIAEVSVTGARTADGVVWSNAEAPEVRIVVGEPASRLAAVFALAADGAVSPGERSADAAAWAVKGTAAANGRVEFDAVARDLAGNETRRRFAYVWDTVRPKLEIADVFDVPKMRLPMGLHVRRAEGAVMTVTVDEPAEVAVSLGSHTESKRIAAAGRHEFALPRIEGKSAATVSARDAAGNEAHSAFDVDVVPDEIRVMSVSAQPQMVIRGDAELTQGALPMIVVFRTYALGEGVLLWTEPLRDASGAPVAPTGRRAVQLPEISTGDAGHTLVYAVPRSTFEDGVHRVSVTAQGDPECVPLELTVDSEAPEIRSVTVALEDGTPVAEGGYATAPGLVVTAEVFDLSLAEVKLDGQAGTAKGGGRFEFRKRLAAEGDASLTVAAGDRAAHTREYAFRVSADWSTPKLELDEPVGGSQCDDVKPVTFRGRVSEPKYTLVVEGFHDGSSKSIQCVAAAFEEKFTFPPVKEATALSLSVRAVDPAGHRSEPVVVRLTEVHRGTDLPPEWPWTRNDVTSLMEQVEPGDVVIGGRVQAVIRVFVDKCEVTNADYRAYLAAAKAAGGHGPWCHPDEPKGWDHTPSAATWNDAKWNADALPVVNVAWWDAFAYAAWTERRLPSEAEWVKAAAKSKAPGETELRRWPPFGPAEWREGVLVTSECAKGVAPALTGDDVSPVGCLHMGGNVSEWVQLAEGGAPGTRGGNWFFSKAAADVRGALPKARDRSFRANTVGFRCAVDASAVQP